MGKNDRDYFGQNGFLFPSGENFPHILGLFQPNVGKNRKPEISAKKPQNSRPTDAKTEKHPRKKKGIRGGVA